ncbi:MAG: glycosyltransferase, partial [Acidobacteriales bacterium]|nr:glycosyltransferase [Terriglobales bacterium]
DFGTTYKAYRGDLLRQLPLYGEMHRFIPAIASAYGASICEVPIQNINRTQGKSNYGFSRTFRVMFDLITIWFLLRYMSRPLHFFGRLGLLNTLGGISIGFWLLLQKLITGAAVLPLHGPLMVFAAILILAGLQLLAVGLLGELSVWQHFNSSKRPYAISTVFHAAPCELAD